MAGLPLRLQTRDLRDGGVHHPLLPRGRPTAARIWPTPSPTPATGPFAQIGEILDKDGLRQLAEQLLYNRKLPLSLPYSQSSFVMDSGADQWETLQTAIGQGRTQTTPMHTLLITSAIANGGTLMRPYLIDRLENAGGQEVKKFMPDSWGELMTAEGGRGADGVYEAGGDGGDWFRPG